MSVVGDNIRALRTLYGEGRDITQVELAQIVGVTRETVNKWETGSIGNVRTSNLDRLRDYFGLTVDDLRSESNGLAARLRARRDAEGDGDTQADESASNLIPLVALCDLHGEVDSVRTGTVIEVPSCVMDLSHRLFAFAVEDDSMTLALPKGSHAVLDLDAVPKTGSIVVVDAPHSSPYPLVRRLYRGTTTAMLSSEGLRATDDIVLPLSDIHVVGVIVWCQSAAVLG